jgi:RNA polymerase sigma-70 factor, ECF subfamily
MTDQSGYPSDESSLITRSQRGDVAAFNTLIERYQHLAYALALRMLGNPDTAADVTQDAFLSAFRAITTFRGDSFRPWLLRIVSNGCYDVFRAQRRHPATSLDEMLDPIEGGSGDASLPTSLVDALRDPEQLALRKEVIAAIEAALLAVAPDQRLAVVLADIHGMSYDDIAQVVGVPVGTVKSRIARGRLRLRALLAQHSELFPQAKRHSNDPH